MSKQIKQPKLSLPQPPPTPQKPGRPSAFMIGWLVILTTAALWLMLGGGEPKTQKSDWTAVRKEIAAGRVDRIVVVNRERAEVFARGAEQPSHEFTIGSVEVFDRDLREANEELHQSVALDYRNDRGGFGSTLVGLLPWLLIIVFWIMMMRGMSGAMGAGPGGMMGGVGRAKAQIFDREKQEKVTFKDVAGLAEAKVEIMEIVDFLKKPDKYKELGGKIPKGALLVGPPGTGKTLLAKAVAGEAEVPFLSISGSDFVEMFVGVGASRVRDLFRQAKEKAPCILFIDEIDAIGRARGRNAGFSSNDERENTLNQLLTEMDGFGTNAGVILLAATNRADILDKALMRAGRFDRQIEVGLPEIRERRQIFDVHLKKLKLVRGLDRSFLARQTPGFSGADIANVCNEAALIAARGNKQAVGKEDFLAAIDRIVGGLERRSLVMSDDEKRLTAYHEAGHATVSWFLKNADPLIKVTIIPRGKALGASWYLPDERHNTTREQFMDKIASLMGGRVAEQVFFGTAETGALNDLERATKMAYAMVAYFGMSEKVGNLSYYDSTGNSDMAFTKPFSEQTARLIDEETRLILRQAEDAAREVIDANRAGLERLAERLLERETVFTEDVEDILGARPGSKAAAVGARAGKPASSKREPQSEKQAGSRAGRRGPRRKPASEAAGGSAGFGAAGASGVSEAAGGEVVAPELPDGDE